MINVDFKQVTTLRKLLEDMPRSAFPLAVRGTLNSFAYNTADYAKTTQLDSMFVLRNSFIKGSVRYQNSSGSLRIPQMVSFAGQLAVYKGRPTRQLEIQEKGLPIVSSGKYSLKALKSVRSGSFSRPVRPANYMEKLGVVKLDELVNKVTPVKGKELAQAVAFATKHKKTIKVIASTSKKSRGVFKVTSKSVQKLYSFKDKTTNIEKKEWLAQSTSTVMKQAQTIFNKEAQRQMEKEMKKRLKKL